MNPFKTPFCKELFHYFKYAFCKGAIIFPISFLLILSWGMVRLYIPEVNLYFSTNFLILLYAMFTLVWDNITLLRRSCCNGKGMELLYRFFPMELFLFLFFAQWHFYLAIVLLVLLLIVYIAFWRTLKQDEKQEQYSRKRHRQYQKIMVHFCVISASILFAIPAFVSMCIYDLDMPTFEANADIDASLFPEENTNEDLFASNKELFLYLKEENWNTLSLDEKITILQRFVDFEANRLSIPKVSLLSKHLGILTLGSYSIEENRIEVNVTLLIAKSPQECMQTLCHEMYHASQDYLISNLNWDSEVMQSSYFDELRSWKYNMNHYNPGGLDYEAYEQQPLEVSADAYAEKEMETILQYMDTVK